MTCYLCGFVPVVKVAYYGGPGGDQATCEETCIDRLYYCADCTSLANSCADPHAGWFAEFSMESSSETLWERRDQW